VDIVQIRDAKAGFSALVTAAENGRPTLVSRREACLAAMHTGFPWTILFPSPYRAGAG